MAWGWTGSRIHGGRADQLCREGPRLHQVGGASNVARFQSDTFERVANLSRSTPFWRDTSSHKPVRVGHVHLRYHLAGLREEEAKKITYSMYDRRSREGWGENGRVGGRVNSGPNGRVGGPVNSGPKPGASARFLRRGASRDPRFPLQTRWVAQSPPRLWHRFPARDAHPPSSPPHHAHDARPQGRQMTMGATEGSEPGCGALGRANLLPPPPTRKRTPASTAREQARRKKKEIPAVCDGGGGAWNGNSCCSSLRRLVPRDATASTGVVAFSPRPGRGGEPSRPSPWGMRGHAGHAPRERVLRPRHRRTLWMAWAPPHPRPHQRRRQERDPKGPVPTFTGAGGPNAGPCRPLPPPSRASLSQAWLPSRGGLHWGRMGSRPPSLPPPTPGPPSACPPAHPTDRPPATRGYPAPAARRPHPPAPLTGFRFLLASFYYSLPRCCVRRGRGEGARAPPRAHCNAPPRILLPTPRGGAGLPQPPPPASPHSPSALHSPGSATARARADKTTAPTKPHWTVAAWRR